MSILETQKIHIVSLLKHKDEILKCLQKNEVLDIQTTEARGTLVLRSPKDEGGRDEGRETIGKHKFDLAEIKSAIIFLEKMSQRKKGLVESFAAQKEEITQEEFSKTCRQFDCGDILKKCKAIESRIANLKNLRNELLNEQDGLLPWQSLNLPLDSLCGTEKINIILGKTKNKRFNALKYALEEKVKACHIDIVHATKDESYITIIHLSELTSLVEDLLGRSGFASISLPKSEKTPKQELKRIASILKETLIEIKENINQAKKLANHLNKLKYMYDLILENKANLEIKHKLADTNYTFIIEGWIKKTDYEKIKSELTKVTREFEIFKIKPAKDEKHPVVLKNPAPFSPFELITNIYGTPKYEEFDPSIPLSFFFALFFGLCLGDFGYGLILAAISFYFLKKYKLPEGGKKLFQLLIFGGFVAVIVGILTGSYLGLSPKEIPSVLMPLKNALTSIQIIDPIKSPLVMLLFSLALGVIQILFGIILQMAMRIRNKEYVSAILDDALWFFFLSSLVFLIVTSALSLPIASLASKLSIAGAVSLVLTQGRHKKTIIQKFFSGLLSLYKISAYLGDTLSYSRLLALGMSTTIIGSVINILAGMVKGATPILGFVLMVVLLIIGHLFNLIIGTLGAFVHSTRLQMVEFFSKFYEGGGREFRPYKRQAEYTIIKSP